MWPRFGMLGITGPRRANESGCYRKLPPLAKHTGLEERDEMSGTAVYGIVGIGGVGGLLILLGMFMVVKGILARAEITAVLLEENATTPTGSGNPNAVAGAAPDAPAFKTDEPIGPINSARTARIRMEEIKFRTLGVEGPYQQLALERRQWFLNGLTIRSALGMAVMGYGVANIAIALGAALVLIGGGAIGVGIPLIVAYAT